MLVAKTSLQTLGCQISQIIMKCMIQTDSDYLAFLPVYSRFMNGKKTKLSDETKLSNFLKVAIHKHE